MLISRDVADHVSDVPQGLYLHQHPTIGHIVSIEHRITSNGDRDLHLLIGLRKAGWIRIYYAGGTEFALNSGSQVKGVGLLVLIILHAL